MVRLSILVWVFEGSSLNWEEASRRSDFSLSHVRDGNLSIVLAKLRVSARCFNTSSFFNRCFLPSNISCDSWDTGASRDLSVSGCKAAEGGSCDILYMLRF